MGADYPWFVVLLFAGVAFLATAGLIWSISGAVLSIRRRWRESVWEAAASLLENNQREVENYVASKTMDAIELRVYELRPAEVPDYERLDDLTREEAIDGMLAHAAENVRKAVEITALRSDIRRLTDLVAAKERARARHWRTIQRLRKQMSPSPLGAAPNQQAITTSDV